MLVKTMLMNTSELRAEVHQMVDNLDESFLRIVHSMLGTHAKENEDPIAGYDIYGEPKRASELMDQYEAELAAAERGEAVPVEVLAEKTRQWLSSIK